MPSPSENMPRLVRVGSDEGGSSEPADRRDRQRHDLLVSVMQTSVQAITVLNPAGEIILINEAAERILGLSRSELTGRKYNAPDWQHQTLDGEPLPDEGLPFRIIMRTARPVRGFQHAIVWPDGARRILNINGEPLFDDDGSISAVVFSVEDITERHEADQRLQAALRDARAAERLFALSNTLPTIVRRDARLLRVNSTWTRVLGFSEAELLIDEPFDWLIHPDDRQRVRDEVERLYREAGAYETSDFEIRLVTKGGDYRWLSWNAIYDPATQLVYAVGVDITLRKADENHRQQLAEEVAVWRSRYDIAGWAGRQVLYEYDFATDSYVWGPNLQSVLGYTHETMPRGFEDGSGMVHPDDERALHDMREQHKQSLQPYRIEFRLRHGNGAWVWYECRGVLQAGEDGEPRTAIGSIRDINDRKQAEFALKRSEQALREQATHDALTGLANRSLLMERIDAALDRSLRRGGQPFAVLFIDINRFKIIIDSLGHLAGDELLINVARRLEAILGPHMLAARMGGDEFVVLVDHLTNADEPTALIDRIHRALAAPVLLENRRINVTVSIGLAMSSGEHRRATEVIRNADIAMLRAKTLPNVSHVTFEPAMGEAVVQRMHMESDLRHALDSAHHRDELAVHYQPIVTHEGRIVGFEALARWQHPTRGLVMPAEFLPIAEDSQLIDPLGYGVMGRALQDIADWRQRFDPDLFVTVNVSGCQLGDERLRHWLGERLNGTVAPEALRIELTETTLMQQMEAGRQEVRALADMGVATYLDDFGMGYSSMNYLQSLPIAALKVDRAFVSQLPAEGCSTSLPGCPVVRAIVNLADALSLTTIAEGIETANQAVCMRSLGCHYMQGFHFHHPMPAADVATLLANGQAAS